MGLDDTLAVGQNVRLRCAQIVWWQAALALADAHRATRAVKAHADIRRRAKRIIEPRAIRIEIEMIRRGGATAQCQFGKAKRR